MTVLLQISDLHFGTEQAAVMEALRELAWRQRPEVLVVSGDITQRARAGQFRDARAFCDSLGIERMLALPGNHDIPLLNVYQRAVDPYRHYRQFFGADMAPVVATRALHVIGVNTTRRWRHKNGEVSAAQVAQVVSCLRAANDAQLRVVVVHQPVHVMRTEDEHNRLRGWAPAVRAWADAGADVVMGGHIHLPYLCEMSAAVEGLTRKMWCLQAGTALSTRVRWEAPNSVNLLRHWPDAAVQGGQQWQAERWDYLADEKRFGLVNARQLALDR